MGGFMLGTFADEDTALISSTAALELYRRAQAVARLALEEIQAEIRPGVTERDLASACIRIMDASGSTGYWWYSTPAYVLAGDRLRLSVEGNAYVPAELPLAEDDMVTIDIHPEIDGRWGDCARSFFLRGGRLVDAKEAGAAQAEGIVAEAAVHALVTDAARPDMTFRELHALIEQELMLRGFENLDFLGNFGHSIGADVRNRTFLDAYCEAQLDSVPLFTVEPHIAKPGERLAFKHEEVYRFGEGRRLQLL
jgi:Xaa-Pro aminopeptidase